MRFSHDPKYIFIHITKTGGCSMATVLPGTLWHKSLNLPHGHLTAQQIYRAMDVPVDDYFKFTFIRNPFDRLYSIYTYNRGQMEDFHRKNPLFYELGLNHFYECSFKEWLTTKKTWASWDADDEFMYEQIQKQSLWFTDDNDNVIVDFIGRFENIENDFRYVANRIGFNATLPHVNSSKRTADYRQVYDQEMIDFVYKHHAEELERFGYDF